MRPALHLTRPLHALLSPVERIANVPDDAKAGAFLVAVWQWVLNDLFTGALALVVAAGVLDYFMGARIARTAGEWNGNAARNGVVGKASGVALCLLIRAFEAWLAASADMNTKGAVATGLAVSLFAVELQSIAHHREAVGARPIPVLSAILDWLQSVAGKKVPPAGGIS